MACITFGAPLVGDKALRKLVLDSGWDRRIHQVVWRHDLVPRILLSPGTCAVRLAIQEAGLNVDCLCGNRGSVMDLPCFLRI